MPALRYIIPAVASCIFISAAAIACQPCIERRSLEKSAKQASVIVWVRNEDRNSRGSLRSGPDFVDLTVKKIIKGDPDPDYVKVRSWYGECAYGAQMQLGAEAILLLEEATDIYSGKPNGTYKLVEDGCSEGQLDMYEDDKILVNDKLVPVSSFISDYGSR